MLAALGLEVTLEAEVEEGRQSRIGAQDDVAARAAVAAARPAVRAVLLAQERDTAAPAVTGFDRDQRFIDELHGSAKSYRITRANGDASHARGG